MNHKLAYTTECDLANSGIPFNEGYNFVHCSCGWKSGATFDDPTLVIINHLAKELQKIEGKLCPCCNNKQ